MTSETAPPSPDRTPALNQRFAWSESREWLSLHNTLARLRAEDARVPAERRAALARARAFVDVADWVLTSTSDAAPEPLFTLYRQAIATLLQQDFAAHATLTAALDGAAPATLEQAVGGAANLDRLRAGLLLDAVAEAPLAEQIALVHLAQRLAHGLLAQAPAQRLERALARRGRRILFTVVAVLAAIAGVVALGRLLLGPVDLARGKTWRTSSDLRATFSADLLFHTAEEMHPWFEIDLGAPVPVRGLWVKNRLDCCLERAVPLVAELSVDRVQWQRPAERDLIFTFWTPTFPPTTARYVRLRALRFTALHLAEVKVF